MMIHALFRELPSPSNLWRFFGNDDEKEKLKKQAETIDKLASDPNLEDYVELSDTDPGEDDEEEDLDDEDDEDKDTNKKKGRKGWGFLG